MDPLAPTISAGRLAQRRANPALDAATWAWCLVLLCLVAFKLGPHLQPLRWNDSYQYLSIASNLQHGLPGYTSIVHYDEERASGAVPAPVTTFPLGYPMLVGSLQLLGLSGESAALLVSAACMVGAILLLNALACRLGIEWLARQWVLALFVLGTWTPTFAAAALSEGAFTCATLGALSSLLGLSEASGQGRGQIRLAVLAGLLIGLSYWLRYAGLFTLLGLLPVAALAALQRRRMLMRDVLIAFMTGGALVVIGMLRNILIVGSWRGGNTKTIAHAPLQILHDFLIGMRDLLLGAAPMAEWIGLRTMLLALVVIALSVGIIAMLRESPDTGRLRRQPLGASFDICALGLIAFTYLACLTYAASRTGITYGARYFYPMLPVLLLCAGLGVGQVAGRLKDATARWSWYGLCLALAAVHAGLQLGQFYAEAVPDLHERIAQRLDARVTPTSSAREVLRGIAGQGVIFANVGQATGYVLQQPTVSLIGEKLGATEWTEASLKASMRRFHGRALVVYKTGADGAVEEFPSRFVERLAAGEAPAWLKRVAASDGMVIYQPSLD